jgi:type II secretory pathway pseudopilin PulG
MTIRRHHFLHFAFLAAAIVLLVSFAASQTPPPQSPDEAFRKALDKYPGLLPEFGVLFEKLSTHVVFPPQRHQSKILPLLSSTTSYYVAIPNYGEPAHQALTIFRQELKESSVLRNWWQQGEVAKSGPQIEDFIEKFYQVSQYLGDEIVVSGDQGSLKTAPVLFAEVRKPGFKEFLQQMLKELPDKSKTGLRILDPKELAQLKLSAKSSSDDLLVLVRPDFVIASPDLEVLRSFNNLIEARKGDFSSTPFGQRVAQAYQGGTSIIAAGDLHTILSQLPHGTAENDQMLDRSGFSDVKYLVWNRKSSGSQSISESELSFNQPRRGVASWLAAPTPLGSLDFTSPKSIMVAAIAFKNFAEIFDDMKVLTADSKPNPFAALPSMEQAMHIILRDDVLSQLPGEVAIEVKNIEETQPSWKTIFRVNDPERLQKTLDKLLTSLPVQKQQTEEGGFFYHSITVPSSPKPTQIAYVFADGYLVVASSRETAREAIALHQSGLSLAKSPKFLASLPPGALPNASVVLYQDSTSMMASRLRQLSPELADALSHVETTPVTYLVYGEPTAIRGVSASGGMDVGVVLVGAAVAIPNLLRARTAANESSAVATLRMLNVAQISYAAGYPEKGYARNLPLLGPDPRGPNFNSPEHASLIGDPIGGASCLTPATCIKSGYRFSLTTICTARRCGQYVIAATPVSASTGTRSFCSTSDAVVRMNPNPDATAPVTLAECKAWAPLQ